MSALQKQHPADRFLALTFRFGKWLSMAGIVVFLAGFLISLSLFLSSGSKFEKPEFVPPNSNPSSPESEAPAPTPRKQPRDKFKPRIEAIVQAYKFNPQAVGIIQQWVDAYDQDKREDFVSGMESYLGDAKAWGENSKTRVDFAQVIDSYRTEFNASVMKERSETMQNAATRMYSMAFLGGSAVLFLIFLIIPVLLQIEINTRRQQ
ncbi:MAG: hypothetical protein OEV94_02330 [Deltaproteobacteria bacterium]|nr:hypothetical protein [Deltaproteobacteria bacterium]